MARQNPIPVDIRLDRDFDRAFEQLGHLVDFNQAEEMFPTAAAPWLHDFVPPGLSKIAE